jgi:integrase/recombinase XerD
LVLRIFVPTRST